MAIGFGTQLCLLTLLAIVVLYQLSSIHRQFSFVIEHNGPVIANARHLMTLVVDMETGQRGFVITGNGDFLEPYDEAISAFEELLAREKLLVAQDRRQLGRLEEIERLVEEWQERAARPQIAMRRRVGQADVDARDLQNVIAEGHGKIILDKMRLIATQMERDFENDGNATGLYLTMQVQKLMVDQETGQRGFLITGKEEFLEPYHSGQEKLDDVFEQLEHLVGRAHNRFATSEDLSRLERLVQQWVDVIARPMIALRSDQQDQEVSPRITALSRENGELALLEQIHDTLDSVAMDVANADNQRLHHVAITLAKCMADRERNLRGYLLTGDEGYLEKYNKGNLAWMSTLGELRDLNARTYNNSGMQGNLANLRTLAQQWQNDAALPQIAARRTFNDTPESLIDIAILLEKGTGKQILDRVRSIFAEFVREEEELKSEQFALATATSRRTLMLTLGIASLAVVVGIIMGRKITRTITKPTDDLSTALSSIAKGDLNTQIDVTTDDEIAELANSFNRMVCDLIRLEEDREQKEYEIGEAVAAAENANKSKSEFLANMSHEIRTPMTAILGFAENMQDKNQTDSERSQCAKTIRRNGEYLLGIINDILDLSKIESGKMTVERIACSPCEIIAEVETLMAERARAKNITLDIDYVGAIPATIQADATRMRQILINLMGNAIKFTESGGVRLVTRLIRDKKGSFLQLDLLDTGCGLTDEQARSLFQPFIQADSSTTRKFGGTGLGLTNSRRFAQLLGGDIVIHETRPGVGTTFRTTLATGSLDGVAMIHDPRSATTVSTESASAHDVDDADLSGYRILLAEDGPDNQQLIKLILRKAGAEVVIAGDGRQAFDAVMTARDEGSTFDVILMDMQMPVMDGYEATKELRQHAFTGPIIALTAHAMSGDREKCIEAGCDDYASKPVDRVKLVATIYEQLAKNQVIIA
ncbi:MAG: CHASE3 domain-containing protein [Planctomycetota bacterium]